MPYRSFLLYNALGGITWASLFGTLGYVFGRNLPTLERYIGQASLALALLGVLLVVLVLLSRRFDLSGALIWRGTQRMWDRCCSLAFVRRLSARYPRAWAFVRARFTPGEFLGLHLTIGMLLSLGALWLFGGITEDVLHHDPLTQFDVALANWFHAHATSLGYRFFSVISLLGSPLVMGVIALLGAAVLVARRRWIVLAGWLAAFAGGGVLDTALKLIIRRPRPEYAAAFLHGQSFSFPSGHAMGSLVGYGMLAYLLIVFWAERRSIRVAVVIAATVLVVGIGFSRLYLGVHYFSDVVAGYAAGVVWLWACISGVEIARRRRGVVVSARGAGESGPSPVSAR
jgi:undecaprenyl-diphosphatase